MPTLLPSTPLSTAKRSRSAGRSARTRSARGSRSAKATRVAGRSRRADAVVAGPLQIDLESIEVLRGPQGLLFGRNVTGGAVLLRNARPNGEFGAKVRVGMTDEEQTNVAAAIEGSLSASSRISSIASALICTE